MANDEVTFKIHSNWLSTGGFEYGSMGWSVLTGRCSKATDGKNGMMGAVGGDYFPLPLNTPVQVSVAGTLRLGVQDAAAYSCTRAAGLEIRLVQCRDASNASVSYPCH